MINLDKLSQYAHKNRINKTNAEKTLKRALWVIREEFKIKFKTQYVIAPYILDFFIPKIGLAIEVDGEYHRNRIEEDSKRQSYLENLDVFVIRFDNFLIENNLNDVILMIKEAVKKRLNCGYSDHKVSNNNQSYFIPKTRKQLRAVNRQSGSIKL